jgi:YgiT-type zinc finger domain-containing protein
MGLKCTCGNLAKLTFKIKTIRHYDKLINIHNVPTYYCDYCGNSFLEGEDAIMLGKLAKIAYENNDNYIYF